MENITHRSWIEAPRWAGVETFLLKLSVECNVNIKTTVRKGWVRETVIYWVDGPFDKVALFSSILHKSLRQYNNGDKKE